MGEVEPTLSMDDVEGADEEKTGFAGEGGQADRNVAEGEWRAGVDPEKRGAMQAEREAWDKMKEVEDDEGLRIKLYDDMPDLPAEELAAYKAAAELMVKTAEESTEYNPPEELLKHARKIAEIK